MNLTQKIIGTIHKIRYNNPFVNGYYEKKREELLNKGFLESDGYHELMTKYSSSNFVSDKNDAEEHSKNFLFRHMKFHKILGGWRWKVMWEKREMLLATIYNKNLRGIDFGGANGPVSLHTDIVDFATTDSFKRVVKYNSFDSLDFKADFLYSSHTLEHVSNLDEVFAEMKMHLKPGAKLYLHVPAYTCHRWQSGVHTNKKFNDHAWTFHLSTDPIEEEITNLHAFDTTVAKHFKINSAEYVGDNSIFVIAEN
jgi:predicted SAM-dependent methyltransferase